MENINNPEKQLPPLLNQEPPEKEECKHEWILKEYMSQPYGTCFCCGETLFNLKR